MPLNEMWKVWWRDVYCETFRSWVGEMILCHLYHRLCPPHFEIQTEPARIKNGPTCWG